MTETAAPGLAEALGLTSEPLAALLAALDNAGEEARVVGGAVRNVLLGLPHGDIDIATTAVPEEVMRRAVAVGFKAVPTGIDHGTVTVIAAGTPFEVTTLRQDIETYGRKAKVEFGRDWKTDAARRDLTINALTVSRDGRVHDYVGGLADLAARRVRFIGDPATRIAEDYLRILRFFRFHAAYGRGAPDPAGVHACIAARAGLLKLSRERVRMELLKLLVAPHALSSLIVMAESGLLLLVLGGVPLLASFENLAKVEAALGAAPNAVRRLGALAVLIVEDAERLWQRLRLANAERERLQSLGDGWWRLSSAASEREMRALLYQLGHEGYVDRVLVAWARSQAGAADAAWLKHAQLPARWQPPAFPLRAADFLARGMKRGPALGEALAVAERAWIAADFPMKAAELAAIADRTAGEIAAR